jgi:hypothetical protein
VPGAVPRSSLSVRKSQVNKRRAIKNAEFIRGIFHAQLGRVRYPRSAAICASVIIGTSTEAEWSVVVLCAIQAVNSRAGSGLDT